VQSVFIQSISYWFFVEIQITETSMPDRFSKNKGTTQLNNIAGQLPSIEIL